MSTLSLVAAVSMDLKSFPSVKDLSIIMINRNVLLGVLALSEGWGRHSLDSA